MVKYQPWVLFVYKQETAVPGETYWQQRCAQRADGEKKKAKGMVEDRHKRGLGGTQL